MPTTAFPDLHVEVETLVADDDQVAFAYTLTGTHNGPFQGHAATGRTISVRGMQISKFSNGKMVAQAHPHRYPARRHRQ